MQKEGSIGLKGVLNERLNSSPLPSYLADASEWHDKFLILILVILDCIKALFPISQINSLTLLGKGRYKHLFS